MSASHPDRTVRRGRIFPEIQGTEKEKEQHRANNQHLCLTGYYDFC